MNPDCYREECQGRPATCPTHRNEIKKQNYNATPNPRYGTCTVLVAVWPSPLLIRSHVIRPLSVCTTLYAQSCGGAFFIDYFLHLHHTEQTLWTGFECALYVRPGNVCAT